jgi:predicted nucleic-acid-binding Zn-ribbon protein
MKTQCPECGSSDIIPDLLVCTDETVSGGMPAYVKLVEPEPPKKPFLWMAAEVKVYFHAAVCGACGHTQLYTKQHTEILEAHKKGYSSQG